jgi:hypothetical protein
MEDKKKQFLYLTLGFAVAAFLLTFMPGGNITGHVSVEAGYQRLNLTITESQAYIVTSDYDNLLKLTSMRLSGEVIGDGKVEVILDNGLGQRLVVYTNEKNAAESNKITGMGKVTGMAIEDGAIAKAGEIKEKALLNLVPAETIKYLDATVPSDRILKSGKFANECKDTCLMEMELSKNVNYKLEFSISEGTQLKLDNMIYGILIE